MVAWERLGLEVTPSFGESQLVIAVVFAVIAVLLVGVFVTVAVATRREVPWERVRPVAYLIRRGWLALLALLLGGAVGVSLFLLPYSKGAEATATVKVTGGQFYWSMTPKRVPAGSRVLFEVTSADVNHGFGVYSPRGVLLGNVQAMPGYTNDLELTLDEPGSYLISCLEFCGVKHHEMSREFRVTGER